jgi:DNA-binding NarL/FixJ family response regulator
MEAFDLRVACTYAPTRTPADVVRQPAAASEDREDGKDGGRTIRVALGEDNLIAREGLVRLFERTSGIEIVAVCSDAQSLRAAVDSLNPDAVVTDIRMPPTSTDEGIQLANELRSTRPDVGVVVVSQHLDAKYALALFRGGAGGRAYLLKERLADEDALGNAVREVVSGGSLVDPLVVEELLADREASQDSLIARLTPRETEILALLAEGRSNEAIGREAGITIRAVERHINSIFSKLELTDSRQVNRRVRAALLYLAGHEG